jgi:hypothetical protein
LTTRSTGTIFTMRGSFAHFILRATVEPYVLWRVAGTLPRGFATLNGQTDRIPLRPRYLHGPDIGIHRIQPCLRNNHGALRIMALVTLLSANALRSRKIL